MADSATWIRLMRGEVSPIVGAPIRAGLRALSWAYGLGMLARNVGYDTGLLASRKLPRPVVSIGNITTGGTGKTPMVLHVAGLLADTGSRPCVLTRGYKPRSDRAARPDAISDEAVLMQESLAGRGRVQVGSDRYNAGLRALEADPALNVFVMDDGFQHRRLARDLDIVLIDAGMHAGLWDLLPRGMFRESAFGLRRADLVIITRADQVSSRFDGRLDLLEAWITRYRGRPADGRCIHAWTGFVDQLDRPVDASVIQNESSVHAVCALGNPDAFFAMARAYVKHGAHVTTTALPDHHGFASFEGLDQAVLRPAREARGCVLTTEKDWVKWRGLMQGQTTEAGQVRIYRPRLSLKFIAGPDPLPGALGRIC
jgi:tetraacyldisaccharide 4'-kinase